MFKLSLMIVSYRDFTKINNFSTGLKIATSERERKTGEVKVRGSVNSRWKAQQTTLEKKFDKCGETINNGEPNLLSILSQIKYHPLKNNSFTPQPGSYLAHRHTHAHTHPNKCTPTPLYSYKMTNTQQRVKSRSGKSTILLLLSFELLRLTANLYGSSFALSPSLQ